VDQVAGEEIAGGPETVNCPVIRPQGLFAGFFYFFNHGQFYDLQGKQ
jgi:hypothetical protein